MAAGTPVEKDRDKDVPSPAPRTAVLVFHGIGDQRPMETMLGVVDAVLGDPADGDHIPRWIKPYVGKDRSFDLKSVTSVGIGDEERRYDFFELYWADLMSGTRLVAVLLWLCDLAKRDPRSLPWNAWWLWGFIVSVMTCGVLAFVHVAWLAAGHLVGLDRAGLALRATDAAASTVAAFVVLGGLMVLFMAFGLRQFANAVILAAVLALLVAIGWWRPAALLTVIPALATLFFFLGVLAALAGLVGTAAIAVIVAGWDYLWKLAASRIMAVETIDWPVQPWSRIFDIAFLTLDHPPTALWLIGFLAFFLVLASIFLVPYVGDAARYLRDAPDNIEARHRIRKLGIEVLEELHERRSGGRPRYDRIVIVAHSLGSVIAYDVLRAFFTKQISDLHLHPDTTRALEPIDGLPDRACRAATFDVADDGLSWESPDGDKDGTAYGYRKLVRAAFEAFNRHQSIGKAEEERYCPWRVSDFVTLGSPLTHAVLLMTEDGEEESLDRKVRLREYPVAPPARSWGEDGRVLFRPRAVGRSGGAADEPPQPARLQHSAMFALTSWTNLYFRQRFALMGDFIGGPISSRHSPGTMNVPMTTSLLGGFFNHTHYWLREEDVRGKTRHILALRLAVLGQSASRRVVVAREVMRSGRR